MFQAVPDFQQGFNEDLTERMCRPRRNVTKIRDPIDFETFLDFQEDLIIFYIENVGETC